MVADVRVEEEREGVLLVLEDVSNVVFVVVRKGRHRNLIAGREPVFLGVRADILVAREHEVDTPLIGPV